MTTASTTSTTTLQVGDTVGYTPEFIDWAERFLLRTFGKVDPEQFTENILLAHGTIEHIDADGEHCYVLWNDGKTCLEHTYRLLQKLPETTCYCGTRFQGQECPSCGIDLETLHYEFT